MQSYEPCHYNVTLLNNFLNESYRVLPAHSTPSTGMVHRHEVQVGLVVYKHTGV